MEVPVVYGKVETSKWEEVFEPIVIAFSMMMNMMLMVSYWLKVPITEILYEIVVRLRELAPTVYTWLLPYEPLVMGAFFGYVFLADGLALLFVQRSRYVSYEKLFSSVVSAPILVGEMLLAFLASLFMPIAFIYVVFAVLGVIFGVIVDKIYIDILGSPRYTLGKKLETAEQVSKKLRKEREKAKEIAKRAFWGIE